MKKINIISQIREEKYTEFLKNNIYCKNTIITTPLGKKVKVLLCDTTASSFPLKIVEKYLEENIYEYYTNTHSNNMLGRYMSKLITQSKQEILEYVGANPECDKIFFDGFGTSGCVNHLVHLIKPILSNSIIFVSVYEHYSNYLPWKHYGTKLVVMDNDSMGLVDINKFTQSINQYSKEYSNIYVSITASSNVVGMILLENIYTIASITHKYGGKIFVDFATGAPYLPINMHKDDTTQTYFDAIYFSPHKFPGAQATPGIGIVREDIICNQITWTPSGGTVRFCSKNNNPVYTNDVETKESGGTPNIIGIIKCCLAIQINKHFYFQIISHELKMTMIFDKYLRKISKLNSNLKILNSQENLYRLPIFAIQIIPYHYNFIVALLCDLFGIMTRGGISCSSVLAEYLLGLSKEKIDEIEANILNNNGVPNDYGWIRISLNCLHDKKDLLYIISAIDYLCKNAHKYESKYVYDKNSNIFTLKL